MSTNSSFLKQNILVIAAHPDDEILGCGGTIAKLAEQGHNVDVAILGEGMTSRELTGELADSSRLARLHSDSHKVADFMGIRKLYMFGLPDNRFDTVSLLEVVKIIETLIKSIRPRIVYTQHGGDLNVDHVITYRATLTATRPMVGDPVERLYAYEVQSSTEWAFQRFQPAFHPNVFVDIQDTLAKKVQAMQLYQSEVREYPHPRSSRAIEAYAHRWGSVSGLQAAEAFELVREIQDVTTW